MRVRDVEAPGYERVLELEEAAIGLLGFIAIHSTRLGPAVGGIRLRSYPDVTAARLDAQALARAMTYKTALAELPCGGAKTVLVQHAGLRREPAFEALGRVIDSLGGAYLAGPDVGVTPADLACVAQATRHVAVEEGTALGDVGEHTAIGVRHGLRACLRFAALGRVRAALQGLGSVGQPLARLLRRDGHEISICDVDGARVESLRDELEAHVLEPEAFLGADCDVLVPCALGGILNARTIAGIRARIVCGSANELLGAPEDAGRLAQRGILYAPDYLVNAGGVIRGAEYYLLGRADSGPALGRIYERTLAVLGEAERSGRSTLAVADAMAEARLRGAA